MILRIYLNNTHFKLNLDVGLKLDNIRKWSRAIRSPFYLVAEAFVDASESVQEVSQGGEERERGAGSS